MEAIEECNQMKTVNEAYDGTKRDNAIMALLLTMYKKCDCRLRYKESLLRRMRNQNLYHEFLKAQEEKMKLKGDDYETRKKFNSRGMYGYQINPAGVQYNSTANSSQLAKRDSIKRESISVDKARSLGRGPCRRTCSSIHNPMFHFKHYDIKLRYCRP